MMWKGQTRGEASERKPFFFKFSHLAHRVVRVVTTNTNKRIIGMQICDESVRAVTAAVKGMSAVLLD